MGTMQSWLEGFELPDWLRHNIIGAEDPPEDDADDADDDADDDSDDSDDDDSDDSDNDDESDDDSEDDKEKKSKAKKTAADNTANLKKALREERLARKKLEREVKGLRKKDTKKTEEEDQSLEEAREALTDAATKVGSLSKKLYDSTLNGAIREAARDAGFEDVEDAIALVERDDIDIEQDEDDPSEIIIDDDSVTEAVKALARKKPHLLGKPGKGKKSGSKFGKKKIASDGKASESALKEKYNI